MQRDSKRLLQKPTKVPNDGNPHPSVTDGKLPPSSTVTVPVDQPGNALRIQPKASVDSSRRPMSTSLRGTIQKQYTSTNDDRRRAVSTNASSSRASGPIAGGSRLSAAILSNIITTNSHSTESSEVFLPLDSSIEWQLLASQYAQMLCLNQGYESACNKSLDHLAHSILGEIEQVEHVSLQVSQEMAVLSDLQRLQSWIELLSTKTTRHPESTLYADLMRLAETLGRWQQAGELAEPGSSHPVEFWEEHILNTASIVPISEDAISFLVQERSNPNDGDRSMLSLLSELEISMKALDPSTDCEMLKQIRSLEHDVGKLAVALEKAAKIIATQENGSVMSELLADLEYTQSVVVSERVTR